MTNNFEDFEHPEMGHEEPPQRGVGSNLAEAWRSKPLFKLMVVMIVVGALVAAGVSFFSGNANKSTAGLLRPPDLNEAPGGKASPFMKEQTELANANRSNEAIKSGGSALPTPIGQSADMGDMGATDKKNESLNELRAELDNMNRELKESKQRPAQPAPPPQQPEQFDDSLAQAMQRQMNQLMEGWTPHGIKEVTVVKPEDLKKEEQQAAAAPAEAAAAAQANKAKILVSAGTVSYAQLLTEANSDVPGPILAQIVSGPLAGARAVGQFQVANGTADYLVLQFNLASLKGKDYALNAIALDPDTTLGGMATEVDQRYFTRVILPAAAGFLQGFGSALGQGSSTTTTNGTSTIVSQSGHGLEQGMFTGLGQAAQTASQFFQNQANQTRPLVRVAAGTPMGMFFISSVTDRQPDAGYPAAGYTPAYPYGVGYPQTGYYGAGQPPLQPGGYPGTTVAGYGQQGYGQQGAINSSGQSVPYPNYATPSYAGAGYGGVSPYNTGYTGYNPGMNPGAAYYPH